MSQVPFNIEDHDDFLAAGISPGMRFRLEVPTRVYDDAEFCGLLPDHTDHRRIIGMRFVVNGDERLSFLWAEMGAISFVHQDKRRY